MNLFRRNRYHVISTKTYVLVVFVVMVVCQSFGQEHYNQGQVFLKLDQYDEAISEFEKVLESNHGDSVLYAISQAYFLNGEDSLMEVRLNEAITKYPDFEPSYLLFIRYLDSKEDYMSAYKLVNRFIEGHPENCLFYKKRAELYAKYITHDSFVSANLEAALYFCNDDEAKRVLLLLAENYVKVEEYLKAKNTYTEVLELAPNDPDVLFDVGSYYAHFGRYNESIELFERYLDTVAHDSLVYFQLGFNYLATEQWQESIQNFHTYIQFDSSDQDGWYNRGLAFASNKDFNLALYDLEKAFELDSSMYEALFNQALVYQTKGEYKTAQKLYTAYLFQVRDDPEAYFNRGYCKYYGDDEHGACGDWLEVKRLGRKDLWLEVKSLCNH